ncbi:MAG: hypothetical protein HC841_06045, partial [Verrucomicrobiae bacterium]|nr:hypothetical protein [Verrucomicrobiae bacterium]
LASHSGEMVAARKPGTKLRVIEDAPGSFVRIRHLNPVAPRPDPVNKQAAE